MRPRGEESIWLCSPQPTLIKVGLLILATAFAHAQTKPYSFLYPAGAQEEAKAFSEKSAVDLVDEYFQGPPYPLFVIRRLLDLADPVALPALERAFGQEQYAVKRELLAAAMVRLGDADPKYFEYLVGAADAAIASDLPFPTQLAEDGTRAPGKPPLRREFRRWVKQHGGDMTTALRQSTIDFPAAVDALGEAADHRALPILLRGLESPNVLVVRSAAFGLARLHDEVAVRAIIVAGRRLPVEEATSVAKALLYFASPEAQQAAESIIRDRRLLARWREEVNRRGWSAAMRDNDH